jgi:predicted small lipoprotein YifL
MKVFCASFLALLLVLNIAACGKKETPPPAAQPVDKPAAQAVAPPVVLGVTSVNLGNAIGADKRVTAPSTSFAKSDTIYAAVETQGSGNMTLKAKWTYHKGDKIAVVNENSQTIAASGPEVSEFHVSMPSGWPAGDYQVEIFANDKSAGVSKFTVK